MRSREGRVYASLRVRGDSLEPAQITAALQIFPTISYKKGSKYFSGERTGEIVGKTGLWLFSTRGIVASDNLTAHLLFLMSILLPSARYTIPMARLNAILTKNRDISADISCFWHGRFGEKRPSIPKIFTDVTKLIPAEIELDFDTDSGESRRRA